LDYAELKTLISRMGEGCKLILLGDPTQIDREHTFAQSGLGQLLETETFRKSELCGLIHLVKCFRGPIAEFMNGVDREISQKLQPVTFYSKFWERCVLGVSEWRSKCVRRYAGTHQMNCNLIGEDLYTLNALCIIEMIWWNLIMCFVKHPRRIRWGCSFFWWKFLKFGCRRW